jgi:putative oxidoreductase
MKKAIERFIHTDADTGAFIARLALAIVFIPHGSQKLLGLFGGEGFMATMARFTSTGMPAALAFLVIMAESLGAIALLMGFIGRFMAFSIGLVMLGAILLVHLQNGFFMNWFGTHKGEGFEYHLLAIGLALVVMVKGSGKYSLDRWINGFLNKN